MTLTEPKGSPQKKRVTLALLSELPPLPLTGKRGHLLSENKLASLEATLVRNSADLLTYLLTEREVCTSGDNFAPVLTTPHTYNQFALAGIN